MSTDNVTPIQAAGGQPPKRPKRPRHEPARQTAEISFGGTPGDGGPSALTIWQGLHGVCIALDEVQACIDHDSVDRLTRLSAAARVLSGLLEDRLMLMND